MYSVILDENGRAASLHLGDPPAGAILLEQSDYFRMQAGAVWCAGLVLDSLPAVQLDQPAALIPDDIAPPALPSALEVEVFALRQEVEDLRAEINLLRYLQERAAADPAADPAAVPAP